jgi:uncharacterized protein (TIGR03000 family)
VAVPVGRHDFSASQGVANMLRRTAAVGGMALLASVVLTAPVHGQAAADAQRAKLRVLLPQDNATLTIEGKPTEQTGTTRMFESPPLDPAKSYTYTLVAKWMPNNYTTITRTRIVPIKAGATAEADLRKADDKQPDDIFVRYVPTPYEIVDAMLKLADVHEGDVVYDLGCGDGRIVVTAVSKNKAKRGVGVDLDPERIKDSKATARAAGVENKVEFRQEDVLKLKDIGDASVVMLYMGEDLNLRLRPILQKSLKPGSRIVSHRFTMGDWKPLKTITVKDQKGTEYKLHLWKLGEDKAKE